jgi:hypothetical protein
MPLRTRRGRWWSLSVALLAALTVTAPQAYADPAVLVYPGMEIRQGTNMCTLGYVDTGLRIAYSAGHCHGPGPVTDNTGQPIGTTIASLNNTPQGATVSTDQVISDYQEIALAPDVAINNILPGGRSLESLPASGLRPGEPVCHFGSVTGESCGTVDRVNTGWFTMANGVVSAKGDSGGPVYVVDGDHAVIVGLFNSTWGQYPAAVTWPAPAL